MVILLLVPRRTVRRDHASAKRMGDITSIHAMDNRPDAMHDVGVDLRSFDLNLLRVLDALLITRSVSGAARRMNLSQPATSAALARLRQGLRDPLLVRTGNRMMPTPLAEELRHKVARVLEDVDSALGAVARFDPATTLRRFRIGANDYTSAVILAPLAARLQKLAPRAVLEIIPVEVATPELGLATRELDLVILHLPRLQAIRSVETLFHETFVSIARIDHPRLGRKKVSLQAFLAEGHVLIAFKGMTVGLVDHALEARGLSRRVAVTVPHYLVAPSIVAMSDLIMTVPRRVLAAMGDTRRLRVFPTPIAVEGFDIGMGFDLHSDADPAMVWLKSQVREVAASLKDSGTRRPR